MPRITEYRPELAEFINKITADVKTESVSMMCSLSHETIRRLKQGRVPEETTLLKFSRGMNCDLDELMIAAGYKEPPLEDSLKSIILQMRGSNHTQKAKDEILAFVKEILAANGINNN